MLGLIQTCKLVQLLLVTNKVGDTRAFRGGGNVENAGMDLRRPPLRWMALEAGAAGLRTASVAREPSSQEKIEIKESLTGFWWFLEIIPFKRLTFTRRPDGKKETHW